MYSEFNLVYVFLINMLITLYILSVSRIILIYQWRTMFFFRRPATLFTKTQTEQLKANCQAQITNNDAGHPDIDFKPVVKLFTPDAQCTWLLTARKR
jgi:hypothetical protein